MTNTITLGSPPAPKRARFDDMRVGQIVTYTSNGRTFAAIATANSGLVELNGGGVWGRPQSAFEADNPRVLLPGESITITVGE